MNRLRLFACFVAIALTTTSFAQTDAHQAIYQELKAQKTFTYEAMGCPSQPSTKVCRQVMEATTNQALLFITQNALAMSKEEEKKMRNRISTLECCLSMGNGASCEGLVPKDIDESCQCRKRLKLEVNDKLRCKK